MMGEKIIASVEVDFIDGNKLIEMELKSNFQIQNCEENKVVVLNLVNGEVYTGIFVELYDDDQVIIKSLSGEITIGININWVDNYLEAI